MKTTLAVTLALLTLGATPRPRPTEVHITFSGIVTHVLDPAHPARAVMVRGDGHIRHRATLYLRASEIEWSDIALSCDSDGTCAIPLDAARVRFAGASGRPTYDTGGSFDMFVPHLRGITGGAMSALRDDVWSEAPANPTFELPAGRYSAVPFERGIFVPDYEQRGARRIAQEVFLSSRIVGPELQFFDGSTWKSIRFHDDQDLIELRFANDPLDHGHPAPSTAHFDLHYALARAPLASKPVLSALGDTHSASTLDLGCGSSSYP